MSRNPQSEFQRIQFRVHPRVFDSLGSDLVTNDVVAVIELVKNSYDAFAKNVWMHFKSHPDAGEFLEIKDDGHGMTRDTVENVWCVVATPFKENNPTTHRGQKVRRVAGEKGLGRLSAARLGSRLHMLTMAAGEDCVEVRVNWKELSAADDLAACAVTLREYPGNPPFRKSGTRIRIYGLSGVWNDNRLSNLEENLSRLMSPFTSLGDFNIHFRRVGEDSSEDVHISPLEFLSAPKYSLVGKVNKGGNIRGTYRFRPLDGTKKRRKDVKATWTQILNGIQDRGRATFDESGTSCGPFEFELRAWDIASDDTREISEKFDLEKSQVRKAIRAHKGISVYRDGVLVLPKSESGRDWLGLDLRRISRVGSRLSTSQLVGYSSISADHNPRIHDTSDRERLAACLEVAEFEELLKAAVELLENERSEDNASPERSKPLENLFSSLSADEQVAEVMALADDGAAASTAVPILRAFSRQLDVTRKTIQDRFVYYSRLATVGTIAQMLVHEIRNRTIAFGSFLHYVKDRFGPLNDVDIRTKYNVADSSVDALERLADTFAPLASRNFRRRLRNSVLEERIRTCIELRRGDLDDKGVRCSVPKTKTCVAVDPGELDAILLNLITNASFWLDEVPRKSRRIEFRLMKIENGSRVRVWVHDTGPGIAEEYIEKVFWPGVTRKPGGIGMGLTVASEIVAQYKGRMSVKYPGTKGGASFAFDLPVLSR